MYYTKSNFIAPKKSIKNRRDTVFWRDNVSSGVIMFSIYAKSVAYTKGFRVISICV